MNRCLSLAATSSQCCFWSAGRFFLQGEPSVKELFNEWHSDRILLCWNVPHLGRPLGNVRNGGLWTQHLLNVWPLGGKKANVARSKALWRLWGLFQMLVTMISGALFWFVFGFALFGNLLYKKRHSKCETGWLLRALQWENSLKRDISCLLPCHCNWCRLKQNISHMLLVDNSKQHNDVAAADWIIASSGLSTNTTHANEEEQSLILEIDSFRDGPEAWMNESSSPLPTAESIDWYSTADIQHLTYIDIRSHGVVNETSHNKK